MKLREIWTFSSIVYKEISFQSIFSLRVGSALPQRGETDIKRLVGNARVSTLISKLVTAFFIAIFGFTVFLPLTGFMTSSTTSRDMTMIGSVTAFLAVVLFLIVFMGLQVSTGFVSSKMSEILGAFPLSKKEISSIMFLCFVRMFDIPLIAAAVVFLSAYFLVGGSILGGLLLLMATVITEIFALALTVGSAKFFYSRVVGSGGRSRWQTLVRLFFMIVWILPTFGAYLVINFAGGIVQYFASLAQSFSSILHFLVLIYPFSYGFLVSYLTFPPPTVPDYSVLGFSIAASFAYIFVALFCFRWVTKTVTTISGGGAIARAKGIVKDTRINPQIPWLGIIRKDLRVASRAPSFASLFLLPAMQTIILAVSFSSFTDLGLNVSLGALIGISMITLLLPPMLLSMEGLASAFTRSLPLKKRTLISAKTLLSIVTYLISQLVLFFVAIYLNRDFSIILTYGGIHAFGVSAGIMLELTLLTRKFWKEGFAVGNIYSRLTTYITTLIPAFVVVFLPIMVAFTASFFNANLALTVFFSMALIEFAAMTLVVAFQK